MATLENIQAKIARLQAEAEVIAKKQSLAAVAKISELMEKHGLTLVDLELQLGGSKRGRKTAVVQTINKRNGAAKYVDPKSGATWTGHGRAPAWIASAKNRNRFLIDTSTPSSSAVAGAASKAGNYIRGPQATKYRDPETGATWSGRGRAPAWLANVKDRSAFLIQSKGAAHKATSAKKAAVTTGAVKKVTTGKVAARKVVAGTAAARKGAVTRKKSTAKKATPNRLSLKTDVVKKDDVSVDALE